MAQFTSLASALAMGVGLAAIAVVWSRRRERPAPDGGEPVTGRLHRVAGDPVVWSLAFLLLVAAGVGGTLLIVTGVSLPGTPPGMGATLLGLLAGAVLAYLCWGFYHTSRHRGLHRPAAIAVAAWVAGTMFVLGVVLRLLEVL